MMVDGVNWGVTQVKGVATLLGNVLCDAAVDGLEWGSFLVYLGESIHAWGGFSGVK